MNPLVAIGIALACIVAVVGLGIYSFMRWRG
jgi:hypothetical protein